jgi:hypothetical protein
VVSAAPCRIEKTMKPEVAKTVIRRLDNAERRLLETAPERRSEAIARYGEPLVAWMWKPELTMEFDRIKREKGRARRLCDHSCGFSNQGYCVACEANILFVKR